MSKIISIGTAVPKFRHEQSRIFDFMHRAYALNEAEKRKLKFLYNHSGIHTRYSVLPDYSLPAEKWQFFAPEENLQPFPSLDKRMKCFKQFAAPLSLIAIEDCLKKIPGKKITHLITVSCTGMSAPGLDIELLDLLKLPLNTWRTSVNFMGCYAAIHALKLADMICKTEKEANVLIVCVEFCTLHFQKEKTDDNLTSSLLFGDGIAAMIVSGNDEQDGLQIDHFYSTVLPQGKQDMVWEMSSKGFLMTLSGQVPDLIEKDFNQLVQDALKEVQLTKEDITHWCVHPGGKKILEAVHNSLRFNDGQLQCCYDVLREYGNMSSPTVLFVLQRIQKELNKNDKNKIFGVAFGPGLTMETFILSA